MYEVDNRRGVKTLLWVMHPGDLLSFPTLGKSIRVAGDCHYHGENDTHVRQKDTLANDPALEKQCPNM